MRSLEAVMQVLAKLARVGDGHDHLAVGLNPNESALERRIMRAAEQEAVVRIQAVLGIICPRHNV